MIIYKGKMLERGKDSETKIKSDIQIKKKDINIMCVCLNI